MKKLYSIGILLSILLLHLVADAGECREKFSWIPNTDEVTIGYKILFGTTNNIYTEEVDVGRPEIIDGRMQGEVLGLNCNTLIHFVCIAYSAEGLTSAPSNQVSVNTVSTEPGRPSIPVGFMNE